MELDEQYVLIIQVHLGALSLSQGLWFTPAHCLHQLFFALGFVTLCIYDVCSTRAHSSLDLPPPMRVIAAAIRPFQWVNHGEVSGVLSHLLHLMKQWDEGCCLPAHPDALFF